MTSLIRMSLKFSDSQRIRTTDPHKEVFSDTVSAEAESTKLQKTRENPSISLAILIIPSF